MPLNMVLFPPISANAENIVRNNRVAIINIPNIEESAEPGLSDGSLKATHNASIVFLSNLMLIPSCRPQSL